MHRVRSVQVEVHEVDEDDVADMRMEGRPGDAAVLGWERLFLVRGEASVDDGVERRLRRVVLSGCQRVLAVRATIPPGRGPAAVQVSRRRAPAGCREATP